MMKKLLLVILLVNVAIVSAHAKFSVDTSLDKGSFKTFTTSLCATDLVETLNGVSVEVSAAIDV